MTELATFAAPGDGRLTDDMLAAFQDDGVLILRGFADPAECGTLRDQALALVAREAPEQAENFFSTTSNVQLSDDYFVRSGSNISYFFEEDAFTASGALKQAKADSLNKMGHAMHDLDPAFQKFSRTPKLAALASSLGFEKPLLVQSMYIFKPPAIGGEVICHQDSTYLYTEPESCVGFWFAIDDADLENGCMHFLPGAHKGPLRSLNHRNEDGKLVTDIIDPTPLPEHLAAPACARRGDLVIFHGRSPHMSAVNQSDRPRHAYTLHMIDGASVWPAENWLQRPADLPFRGFD